MNKHASLRLLFAYSICAVFLGLSGRALAQSSPARPLFHFVDTDNTDLTDAQSRILSHLDSKKWTVAVSVVTLDEAAFGESKLVVNLGKDVNFTLDRANSTSTRERTVWTAVTNDTIRDVTFIQRGNNVTGTIVVQDQLISLRPLGGGLHALVTRNQSEFPPDHPPEFEAAKRTFVDEPPLVDNRPGQVMDGVSYRIDVLVVYTQSVVEVVADVSSLIDLAIEETNKSYHDSSISASLRLVHHSQVDYRESGSFKTDVDRLAAMSDGYIDSIHSLRNTHNADVVVMLINDDQACGRAKAIYAEAATAFAVCHHDCATGYYSFGHEILHLQGARHNPEADPTNTPLSYGHGYYNSAKHWRTIMSYNCPGGCTRQRLWSNPNSSFNGDPTGTQNGHFNAKVLDATAARVAAFR